MNRRTYILAAAGVPFLAGCTSSAGNETLELRIETADEWFVRVLQSNYEATESTNETYNGDGDDTIEVERELENMNIFVQSREGADADRELTLQVLYDGDVLEDVELGPDRESATVYCGEGTGEFGCSVD